MMWDINKTWSWTFWDEFCLPPVVCGPHFCHNLNLFSPCLVVVGYGWAWLTHLHTWPTPYWMKTMLTLHSAADSAALSVAVKMLHQPKKPLPAYCWHAKLNNSVIVHHAIRRSSFCSVNSWWQPTLTDQRLGSFVQVGRNSGRSKQTSLSDTLKFFGQVQLPEWNLMEYL